MSQHPQIKWRPQPPQTWNSNLSPTNAGSKMTPAKVRELKKTTSYKPPPPFKPLASNAKSKTVGTGILSRIPLLTWHHPYHIVDMASSNKYGQTTTMNKACWTFGTCHDCPGTQPEPQTLRHSCQALLHNSQGVRCDRQGLQCNCQRS